MHLPALVVYLAGLKLPAFVEALATLGLGLFLLSLVAVATRHELLLRQLELTLRELLLFPLEACRRIGGSKGSGVESRDGIISLLLSTTKVGFSEAIRGFRGIRTAILARERAVAPEAVVHVFDGLGHRYGRGKRIRVGASVSRARGNSATRVASRFFFFGDVALTRI